MKKIILIIYLLSAFSYMLFSQSSECDYTHIMEYDARSRLSKLTVYEGVYMKNYAVYKYFTDTLFLKIMHYTPEGKVIDEQTFEYNLKYQNTRNETITFLTEQFDIDSPGGVKYLPFDENIIIKFEYDSSGRITEKQTIIWQTGDKQTEKYFYSGSLKSKRIYHNSDGGYSDTTFYDYNPAGLLIRSTVKRKDSEYNYYTDYEYDSLNRPTRENFHAKNSAAVTGYIKYEYDENGNMLSEIFCDVMNGQNGGKTHSYDKQNRRIKTCGVLHMTELKSK